MTTIKVVGEVDGPLADEAWTLYEAAFRDLNRMAVQRHLMYRDEFGAVMADPRVDKYLAFGGDNALHGVATYTNDLDAVPLISPAYFAHRWPERFRERRIWYIGFVAVHPDHQRGPAFAEIVEEFRKVADAAGGIVGMDVCAVNAAPNHHLPRAVLRQVQRRTPLVEVTKADAQSYWLYEFPEATP